jgi:Domain of unknown function (DUF6933)
VVVVRGTKKFLDRVGGPASSRPVSTGALGDWYANVWFWRPQVAVFVNEATRLPVIMALAPAKSLLDRFPDQLARVAKRIGVDGAALDGELEAMSSLVLARTDSRSVLGTMNDFSHQADRYRWRSDVIDLVELSLWLAETPCSPLFAEEGSPDRELRVKLGTRR